MSSDSRDLEFYKFVETLSHRLRPMHEPRKALAHALRECREFFKAARGCIAVADESLLTARVLAAQRSGVGPAAHRTLHPPQPSAGA
jgi:GAF domain-containing protein